jgi:hypothetical protein
MSTRAILAPSELKAPKNSLTTAAGLKPRQALLFESVSEYVFSVARVDSRTQEPQRGRNGLSWFEPIDALRPAADDLYTQEHPKSGVTT